MRNGLTSVNVDPVNFYCTNQKNYKMKENEVLLVEGTDVPLWVVANLKRYNNCFIQKCKWDLEVISQLTGFKVCVARCNETSGYVLYKEGTR